MDIPKKPLQFIMVADEMLVLPEGVTVADWGLEKMRTQNPRIRSIVGCLGLLDEVMESNYALLHCSPERLTNIWKTVQRVKDLLIGEVANLLRESSAVPRLAETCERSSISLNMLHKSVLVDLDREIEGCKGHEILELRKILCVSIGQMYTFLQDTLGAILAADPRGKYDADYFLSRRFPRDVEEAEWLYYTVSRFRDYLKDLELRRKEILAPGLLAMKKNGSQFSSKDWALLATFLDELTEGLTPKLREVLALRGIRFDEMEIIDGHSFEIPAITREVQSLWTLIRDIKSTLMLLDAKEDQGEGDIYRPVETTRKAVISRMAIRLTEIDNALRDLVAFIPLWLNGVKSRRALFLGQGDISPSNLPPNS